MLNSQSQLACFVKVGQYYSELSRSALVKLAHISMILCILMSGVNFIFYILYFNVVKYNLT